MSTRFPNLVTGHGSVTDVRGIANTYRNVVNLSRPVSGRIQRLAEDNYSLTCQFNTTDCDSLESINTTKAYSLSTVSKDRNTERCIDAVRCITDAQTLTEATVATSKNGRFLARLKKSAKSVSNDQDKKQLLEIWDRSKLLKTIDISELETHGQISTDPHFGSFYWCPFGEQNKLLYVCKEKKKKFPSFFKQADDTSDLGKNDISNPSEGSASDTASGDANSSGKGKATNLGEDYAREEDWGECLKGIEHTIVAILDTANDCKISTVDMSGFSLGDSKWLDSDGMKTISVAYPDEPRRLGMMHSNNRPSRLVVHDWSQSPPVEVSELNALFGLNTSHCFHHPRISNCGKKFVYLTNPIYGPHIHSVRMHYFDMDTKEDKELVDVNTQEVDLFVGNLNSNCFSADDRHILFVKNDHLHNYMCLYNLDKSKITKIKFPTTGLALLDFCDDIILATGSEVDATPTLFVSVLNTVNSGELVAWHQIEDCIHLDEIEYNSYTIPTADQASFVSALLVSPRVDLLHKNFSNGTTQLEQSKLISSSFDLPTVVIIHGGPHSAFGINYMPTVVVYARLGLRSLLINYRGSTGVSEDYLRGLCGKVGQLDVDDCMHTIRYFVDNKLINPGKLIVQGGSHGGFLACHLSCQKEFKFTSAIIRNPVVDMYSMLTTSDMPDWVYTEALGRDNYDFSWLPDHQDLAKMFDCSPISKVDQANVPTLMLLGNVDYRVKMSQGERWVDALRARGIETMCKVYADKHDLSKVDVASDGNISSLIWILSHLK